MTLQEFFDWLSLHPVWVLIYFLFIPIVALIAGLIGKGEGHLSPWKYMYSTLIYLVCIPGLFAIFLSIYLFLFESRSIMETNLHTQVLPVLSMIITLLIIRWNVDLDYIPGFEKLSGLIFLISALLIIMIVIDRSRLLVFSFVRIEYVLLLFVALLLLARWGWRRLV